MKIERVREGEERLDGEGNSTEQEESNNNQGWQDKGNMACVNCSIKRRVHTMKVMRIGSELICIVCVHTECTLTAIRIESAFSQSSSIGGLKTV